MQHHAGSVLSRWISSLVKEKASTKTKLWLQKEDQKHPVIPRSRLLNVLTQNSLHKDISVPPISLSLTVLSNKSTDLFTQSALPRKLNLCLRYLRQELLLASIFSCLCSGVWMHPPDLVGLVHLQPKHKACLKPQVQGYPQRMRLQRRLYRRYTVYFLIFKTLCNFKLVSSVAMSINKPLKDLIQSRRLNLSL